MEILLVSTSNNTIVGTSKYGESNAFALEDLVNISKRRAFWSLNEDILKINDSDYQYAVSIKEDMANPCLHSPKTTKETSSIRRIQRRPIRRIEVIVCEDSRRYQAWSLLQETPNTSYPTHWIHHQLILRVFPISLTGAASRWLRNEPTGSIKIWEDLKTKFLNKYCPPGRTAKKMEEINNFQQEPDETLYQAWERFKELLMKCTQHYLTEMQEVILFYNGLDIPTRQILDSRGAIPSKTAADAKTAIQEMATYS
ncbi:hypothetical protein Tco_1319839 [Tanacetum coccineum]